MALMFFDHTADVGVRVTAASRPALSREAALAMTTTVTDPWQVEAVMTRTVVLRAPDVDQLLVDWLSELVGWFDIDLFLARSTTVALDQHDSDWQMAATAIGESFDPARHHLKFLVKGVTYHDSHVERTAAGFW